VTDWTPPRSEGLRHAALPGEELATVAGPDDDVSGPGIYAILLSTPDTTSVETHARLWREQHETTPEYLETIAASDRVVYIGAAKNVRDRVADHVAGKQTSAVMEVFPPHSVWGAWYTGSVDEAFERESMRAMDLNNRFPSCYFHSR